MSKTSTSKCAPLLRNVSDMYSLECSVLSPCQEEFFSIFNVNNWVFWALLWYNWQRRILNVQREDLIFVVKWLPQLRQHIHNLTYSCSYFFSVCVVRTFKIYTLSKYQVCDIVLLIIVTILYLRYLQGIYFISENLYCLANISFHPPPASDNRHSIFCFYEFNMFRFNMWMRLYSICFSLPDFFHLAYPSGPSMLSKCQDFFFLWPKNVPLSSSICLLMDV